MFKDVFIELLQSKGKKASQLSCDLGISSGLLSEWKNGAKIPSAKYLSLLAGYFGVSVDYLLEKEKAPAKSKGRVIPVYGRIAAGIPIDSIAEIIDYEEIPDNYEGEYIALLIRGDSMETRIVSGDIVIIRLQPDVESGQVAAVMIENESATCKRVIKHANGITLESFNKKYDPMYFPNKEILELPVTIIGRVVEVRGKI